MAAGATSAPDESLARLQDAFSRQFGNGSGWSAKSAPFAPLDASYAVAAAFIALGGAAILLNALILVVLLANRRHVFKHVFYVLITNFTLIDALKGFCLILWALKTFKPASGSILILKIDQITTFLLRFCNLATVLNLLMLTANEFFYINYPLRYDSIVTNCRVGLMILLSWLGSLVFTGLSSISRKRPSVYVGPCAPTSVAGQPDGRPTGNWTTPPAPRRCIIKTKADDGANVALLALIAFCVGVLVVVLVCYSLLLRMIARIQRLDAAQQAAADASPAGGTRGAATAVRRARSGDERRVYKRLLRRHKYLLVIGLVISVYVAYLLSYAAILFLQYKRLSSAAKLSPTATLVLRWTLQLFVGLNSIVQPLCYFRMKEFRRLFCRQGAGAARRSFVFLTEQSEVQTALLNEPRNESSAINGRRESLPLNRHCATRRQPPYRRSAPDTNALTHL